MDTALANATRPHDFKLLVQGEGRVGTTMDDVIQDEETPDNAAADRDPSSLIPGL
jgi:hypothetical protein